MRAGRKLGKAGHETTAGDEARRLGRASRKDLKDFPEAVRKEVGDALQQTQRGLRPLSARPLSGFRGAGVLEIREDHDGDTYRAVYTVRLAGRVYVLHAFQKKSRHGIETAKHDVELIRARLRMAEDIHRELSSEGQEDV